MAKSRSSSSSSSFSACPSFVVSPPVRSVPRLGMSTCAPFSFDPVLPPAQPPLLMLLPPQPPTPTPNPDNVRRAQERGRVTKDDVVASWGREHGLVVFDDVDRAPSTIVGLFAATVSDSRYIIGLSANDRHPDLLPSSFSSSRSSLPSCSLGPHRVAAASPMPRQTTGRLRTTAPDLPYLDNLATIWSDPLPQFRSQYYQQSLRVPPDRGDTGLPFRLEWHEEWWRKAADPLQNYSAIGLRTWMRQQRRMAAPLRMSAFMHHLNRYVLPQLDVATAQQLRCAREFFAELAEHVEPTQLWFDPFAAGSDGVARKVVELSGSSSSSSVAATAAMVASAKTSRIRIDGDHALGVGHLPNATAIASVERRSPRRVFRLASLLTHLIVDQYGGRCADYLASFEYQMYGDGGGPRRADVEVAERNVERDGLLSDLVRYEWLDGADLDDEAFEFEFESRRHAIYQSTCAALALEKRDAIAAALAGTALYPPPLVRLVIDYNAVARHAPAFEITPTRPTAARLGVNSSLSSSSSSPTLIAPPLPRTGE